MVPFCAGTTRFVFSVFSTYTCLIAAAISSAAIPRTAAISSGAVPFVLVAVLPDVFPQFSISRVCSSLIVTWASTRPPPHFSLEKVAVTPLAFVTAAVSEDHNSPTVPLAVAKASLIALAIRPSVNSLPGSPAIAKLPHVAIAVGPSEGATTVHLAIPPVALVTSAVGPIECPPTMLRAVANLTLVIAVGVCQRSPSPLCGNRAGINQREDEHQQGHRRQATGSFHLTASNCRSSTPSWPWYRLILYIAKHAGFPRLKAAGSGSGWLSPERLVPTRLPPPGPQLPPLSSPFRGEESWTVQGEHGLQGKRSSGAIVGVLGTRKN